MRSFQEFKWLSTPFTEEEAKAVKKAFKQVSLEKQLFLEYELKWSKEKTLDLWKMEKGGIMENYDEFMEYLKRNPEAVKDDFRRRTTIQCLEEYENELADRRNFYKGCTKEYDILEKRRKEIIKVANFVKEEMWISYRYKIFSGKEA